ncbi:MAG: TrmB family transcriptional regulator [Calditrichaeota bacterium]|nr:TrmB family transcriptional regulator [Calditrichota bacterium]
MNLEKISRKMMELGFTSYEARAYVALLQQNPATRYELSKRSGVPRSAIYDIIQRLERQGLVNALATKPEKYVPLPPDRMLELLERRYKERIEELKKSLTELRSEFELEQLWNITGYQNLIIKAKEMINKARSSIYLSAWKREVLKLQAELEEAVDRGVKVVIFSFTEVPQIGQVFSYELNEKELEKVWDHKIILVRDMEELLMGEANQSYPRKVAWTHNKAIVGIAANHIVLDITLYGLRAGVDVSDAVIEAHPGELELLGRLLREKFPDNPWLSLDFSKNNNSSAPSQ